MTKDKTTYSTPEDDSPKMASEPVEARGCVTEKYGSFSHHSLEKDTYTPEEVLEIILTDIRKIYAEEDMSAKGIEALKQKEELTVEEMQALLLNMVDEEYSTAS